MDSPLGNAPQYKPRWNKAVLKDSNSELQPLQRKRKEKKLNVKLQLHWSYSKRGKRTGWRSTSWRR